MPSEQSVDFWKLDLPDDKTHLKLTLDSILMWCDNIFKFPDYYTGLITIYNTELDKLSNPDMMHGMCYIKEMGNGERTVNLKNGMLEIIAANVNNTNFTVRTRSDMKHLVKIGETLKKIKDIQWALFNNDIDAL